MELRRIPDGGYTLVGAADLGGDIIKGEEISLAGFMESWDWHGY